MTKPNRYVDSQPGRRAAIFRGGTGSVFPSPHLILIFKATQPSCSLERVTKDGPAEAKTVGLGISSGMHVFRKIYLQGRHPREAY